MITKSGMVAISGTLEKDAWIADVLNEKTLRGVGRFLRTSSRSLRSLYRGAESVGRGVGRMARTGAVGLERAGDALRRHPLRVVSMGIPAVYGVSRLTHDMDRNLNNIHPNNPYMHA